MSFFDWIDIFDIFDIFSSVKKIKQNTVCQNKDHINKKEELLRYAATKKNTQNTVYENKDHTHKNDDLRGYFATKKNTQNTTTANMPVVGEKNDYLSSLETAMKLFEEGDFRNLHIVYGGMIKNNNNTDYIMRLGNSITAMLDTMSCTQKIRLSENFRQFSSMEWYNDWREFDVADLKHMVSNEQDFLSILMIGSIHPNGYYREKCLNLLSGCRSALPFIVLRINDWVGNIRESAYRIAYSMCEKCTVAELISITPYILKVDKSQRRDDRKMNDLYEMVIDRIKNDITEEDIININLIREFQIKKYAYKMLFSKEILSSYLAKLVIKCEKNKFLNSYVTCRYIALYMPSDDEIDLFIQNKSMVVRYTAAQYKYNHLHNVWDGAEKLLIDKYRTIREFMVFIFKKHTDFDINGFYKQRLDSEDRLYAVCGLGECGTEKDAELIIPYLDSQNFKTIKESLIAIRNLTGSKSDEIYWRFLFNECTSVSKTAYRIIIKGKMRYGAERVYNAIQKCDNKDIRRYLINMLIYEDSWERMPYLMDLYEYEYKHEHEDYILRAVVCHAIENCNPYARISEKLGDEIRARITKYHDILSENTLWKIEHNLKYVLR